MRGLTRRWQIRQPAPANGSLHSLNLPPLIERIFLARGLADADYVRSFCDPRLTDLHDPSLIPNLDLAAAQICNALRARKSIVIYGDYDVDGMTATAILFHVLRAIDPDARIATYVPHRLDEGYGLNPEAMQQIRADGGDLVITVDCGVTGAPSARIARECGLELIITDHHTLPPEDALPDAIVVHPALPHPDVSYPFPDLCGAGVAFKLAWRIATTWCNSERVSESLQRTLLDMLPLAALGTIADVMPLTGENRVIARHGLQMIRRTPIVGLCALLEASKLLNEDVDAYKVGFILAPRLNACGRMDHASDAVHLLTSATTEEARHIAQRLTKLNEQRQRTEREIVAQAMQLAEDSGMTRGDRRAIVLAHPNWHAGVVGIVCSRLVDRFGRPTILMQQQGDFCKGSARSIDGYSMYDALAACSDHLAAFGGHAAAAGLTIETARLEAFAQALTEHANSHIAEDELTPAISIDCDATLHEMGMVAVRKLNELAPFGRANRRPMIRVREAIVAEPPRQIGGEGRHLAIRIRQDGDGGRKLLRCVWWKQGSLASDLAPGMRLDLAIEPRINTWNGRSNVEAEIKDVMLKG